MSTTTDPAVPSTPHPYSDDDRHDVIVVGGGQAGLAIGWFLSRQGLRFKILEAAGEAAAAWRSRWDSLRLFTPAGRDGLPEMPFPGDPDSYPGRDDVADYLTEYARRFELPVELNAPVRSIRRSGEGYVLDAGGRVWHADQVVVATGPFQDPHVPAIASELDAGVTQMHSAEYRSPRDIAGGPVLVVGGGNTGFQIAAELAETHEVHLAVGSRQTPLPQRLFGRDLFGYLEATGLMGKTVESRIGGRMRDRDTLIGSSPRKLRRLGVRLHPRAVSAAGRVVGFADGADLEAGTVVWATGFRADHSFIDLPVFDDESRLEHERGVTASAGLYFLGLPWQHTRGSALLGWVKDDAEFISGRVTARLSERTHA